MKSGLMIMILAGLVFTGCSGKKDEAAGPPMGPVSAILAKADKQPVKDTVNIIGSIMARDEVTILSELDSTIKKVAISEGDRVKKGQTLFQLDSIRTAAMLSEAQAAYKLANLSHKRNEGLLKNDTISKQAYDEAEATMWSMKARLNLAKDAHSKATITAPFEGMVGERSVSIGQFVTRGQLLLSMVRTDPLDIVGDVPERYLAHLKNLKTMEFKSAAYPDRTFEAAVQYVSPTIDSQSRTIRVKASFSNKEGLLMPGMFGNVSLILEERTDSLIIPEACIQMQGASMMVVRVNKEGMSEFAPVTTGQRSKGYVEIISGLNEGDLVVVEGWQKMGPGMPVMAAPESKKYGVEVASPETEDKTQETGEK
jgi:membrane fusion protein (multidrug efflux system)